MYVYVVLRMKLVSNNSIYSRPDTWNFGVPSCSLSDVRGYISSMVKVVKILTNEHSKVWKQPTCKL